MNTLNRAGFRRPVRLWRPAWKMIKIKVTLDSRRNFHHGRRWFATGTRPDGPLSSPVLDRHHHENQSSSAQRPPGTSRIIGFDDLQNFGVPPDPQKGATAIRNVGFKCPKNHILERVSSSMTWGPKGQIFSPVWIFSACSAGASVVCVANKRHLHRHWIRQAWWYGITQSWYPADNSVSY